MTSCGAGIPAMGPAPWTTLTTTPQGASVKFIRRVLCTLFGHEWLSLDVLDLDLRHYIGQVSICYRCGEHHHIPA